MVIWAKFEISEAHQVPALKSSWQSLTTHATHKRSTDMISTDYNLHVQVHVCAKCTCTSTCVLNVHVLVQIHVCAKYTCTCTRTCVLNEHVQVHVYPICTCVC